MAERKQGPVKPPTIDLTARDATAEPDKAARRASRVEADEVEEAVPVPEAAGVTAADADGVPPPQPIPPRPPTPPEPPRVAAVATPTPWGMLGTAAVVGALLGTAFTYVLATFVPLPGPVIPNLAPALSEQADRVTTLEERLAAAEAGTLDTRAASDAAAGDIVTRLTALEGGLTEVRAAAQPVDTSAIEARLRTLTSRVDAIGAGASSADAGAMADNIGDLEVALAALQAEVAALSTQSGTTATALSTLETDVAALKTDIETAAAESEPEPAPPSVGIPVILPSLETAFATGRPFATEIAALQAEQPPVAVDEVISSRAGTGLVRPDLLDQQFAAAIPVMLEARPASGESWQDAAGDMLSSLLAIRPAGETEGDTPEAVMSRVEGAMSRHDYAAARDMLALLPPEMTAAAGTVPADIAAHAAAAALIAELRGKAPAP